MYKPGSLEHRSLKSFGPLQAAGSRGKLESACGMTVKVVFNNQPESNLANQVMKYCSYSSKDFSYRDFISMYNITNRSHHPFRSGRRDRGCDSGSRFHRG